MMETPRLRLRQMLPGDASFLVSLLNDPAFLRFVGDRGVRSVSDAFDYIEKGPTTSYTRHGFGLNIVEPIDGGEPIGICGLLKREELDAPDLGFALLPDFRGLGFAREAAAAVLQDARGRLGLRRVLAIAQPDNQASITLLERLGFRFERLLPSPRAPSDVRLYACTP
jgi:[ribosomal protein S5]-alanine N-acetyltransferase